MDPHAPMSPPSTWSARPGRQAAADRGRGAGTARASPTSRVPPHRDEEHGDAGLHGATLGDIAEETTAALEGDVEPEEHLGEPLVDPSDAKAAAARALDDEQGTHAPTRADHCVPARCRIRQPPFVER